MPPLSWPLPPVPGSASTRSSPRSARAAWGTGPTYALATSGRGFQVFTTPRSDAPAASDAPVTGDGGRVFPSFLADGQRLLFVQRKPGSDVGEACIGRADRIESHCLGVRTSSRVLAANGALVYLSNRELVAQPFDEVAEVTTGTPVRLASDVAPGSTGIGAFSISSDGTLAYRTGDAGAEQLTWFDRAGRPRGTEGPRRIVTQFDLSRDGRTLVLTDGASVWVTDIARAVTSLVDVQLASTLSPVVSSDGLVRGTSRGDVTRRSGLLARRTLRRLQPRRRSIRSNAGVHRADLGHR